MSWGDAPEVDTAALREEIRARLLAEGAGQLVRLSAPERRLRVRDEVLAALRRERAILPAAVVTDVVNQVSDEVVGLGPIERLLRDPEVSEVMVNGADDVFVERKGRVERVEGLVFEGEDQVLHLIERIVSPLGLRVDESSPYVDARLSDGSRVNAIIPPLSLCGPVLTIRKFGLRPFTPADLVAAGSMTEEMMRFLGACVRARANIVVSGGTGSGKTTLLGVLSSFIPSDERLVTIEDAAELRLAQPHVISLEARPPNVEGAGEVTVRALVRNALRMRPDRIIVGEVRGGEALDMLQAMNTGHEGSLSTLHANSPTDTVSRLETMALMSELGLPASHVREQISGAVDVIVHTARLGDGRRVVTHVTAVDGLDRGSVRLQDVVVWRRGPGEGFEQLPARARIHVRLAERGEDVPVTPDAAPVGSPTTPASASAPTAPSRPRGGRARARRRSWAGATRQLGIVVE